MLRTQMFPRLPVRATFVAGTIFVCDGGTKNVSDFCQNILCPQQMFSGLRGMDTKQTFCVPLVCPPKKHREQQCVLVCQHSKRNYSLLIFVVSLHFMNK